MLPGNIVAFKGLRVLTAELPVPLEGESFVSAAASQGKAEYDIFDIRAYPRHNDGLPWWAARTPEKYVDNIDIDDWDKAADDKEMLVKPMEAVIDD